MWSCEPLCALLETNTTLRVLCLSGFILGSPSELLAVAAALARNKTVEFFSIKGVRRGLAPPPLPSVPSHCL